MLLTAFPEEYDKDIQTKVFAGIEAGLDRAAWRKSGTGFYQIPDNSNTQFAVLALWAAYSLSDYDVPQKAWEKIRQNFLKGQLDDGAWSYRKAPKSPSLTMTASEGLELMLQP